MPASNEPFVVAVDWGTSNFRLWVLSKDGTVISDSTGNKGMSVLKPDDYPAVLANAMSDANAPADLPVLICGMAGAAQGWCPAPYTYLPATLAKIPDSAICVPNQPLDIRILPGAACDATNNQDVMRGEETTLLGASFSGIVCMPGTHSKWVNLSDGTITKFRTFMTGEMFAVLKDHSTLAPFLNEAVNPNADAFAQGVERSVSEPDHLLNSLFSIRAKPLIGQGEADQSSYLSGLLIGAELVAANPAKSPVELICSGPLDAAYKQALELLQIDFAAHDAELLTRAGLFAAAKSIWN